MRSIVLINEFIDGDRVGYQRIINLDMVRSIIPLQTTVIFEFGDQDKVVSSQSHTELMKQTEYRALMTRIVSVTT